MTHTVWRDSLSVGVTAIDRDHKILLQILNRLRLMAIANEDPVVVAELLEELKQQTRTHFRREEWLMVACSYPWLDEHRDSHDKLLLELDRHVKEYNSDPSGFSMTRLHNFVADWIERHLMNEDMRLKPYVEHFANVDAA